MHVPGNKSCYTAKEKKKLRKLKKKNFKKKSKAAKLS